MLLFFPELIYMFRVAKLPLCYEELALYVGVVGERDAIFLQPAGGFWVFPTVSNIIDLPVRDDLEGKEFCLTSYNPRF